MIRGERYVKGTHCINKVRIRTNRTTQAGNLGHNATDDAFIGIGQPFNCFHEMFLSERSPNALGERSAKGKKELSARPTHVVIRVRL
jgi:hypothetical protein